ncbi:hypothetical protein [Nocardioides endophyticus]|uniref:hypothetical protein n=1 Tax=Nocardioides endophyticus TaxID=1353775 RepID=UPI0031E7187C
MLATAHVDVDADGHLHIDIDGKPFAADRPLTRNDLSSALDEVTTSLGTAVRVQVRESDGTTYTDIATPPQAESTVDISEPGAALPMPGLHGTGFTPGEEVALAFVVARRPADANGQTAVHLPPALAAAHRHGLVLLGMTSQIIVTVEQPT